MENRPNQFGKSIIDQFTFDSRYTNVNNGSFGQCPKQVLKAKLEYEEEGYKNTEKWMRYEAFDKLNEIKILTGEIIHCDPQDLVFVTNATESFNAVFKSLDFEKGDKILATDITYQTLKNVLQQGLDKIGIEIVRANLTKENLSSNEKILSTFEQVVEQHKSKIKLAVIDHISSNPAIIFPIKEICQIMHKYSIDTFVDGAHSLGQIKIDILDINPEYYCSNFHKWFFAPRSTAFLYVKKSLQTKIFPSVLGYYKKGFAKDFFWRGTSDYSSILAIKDAHNFIQKLGGQNQIMEYNHKLIWEAGKVICQIWNTELLSQIEEHHGSMINVQIPLLEVNRHQQQIEELQKQILYKYNTFIPIFPFSDGKFYARFSAQIFNEIEDFKFAAESALVLIKEFVNKK